MAQFDLMIRNGLVLDGTGQEGLALLWPAAFRQHPTPLMRNSCPRVV